MKAAKAERAVCPSPHFLSTGSIISSNNRDVEDLAETIEVEKALKIYIKQCFMLIV